MLTERQIPLDEGDEGRCINVQLGPTGRLKGSHCKVMIRLLSHANEQGVAFIGRSELAREIPMHTSSVRRAISEMERLGHLSIIKGQAESGCYYRIATQFLCTSSCEEKDSRQLELLYLLRSTKQPLKEGAPLRTRVLAKGNGRCWYCGWALDPEDFDVEHIVPRAKGGGDDLVNLAPSCGLCNAHKGTALLEEFRAKVQRLSGNDGRHLFFFERDAGGADA